MKQNGDKIAENFLREVARIKDINYLIALTKLLGIQIDNEDKTARPFEEVLNDLLTQFNSKPRNKRKELVSLLKKANKAVAEETK